MHTETQINRNSSTELRCTALFLYTIYKLDVPDAITVYHRVNFLLDSYYSHFVKMEAWGVE